MIGRVSSTKSIGSDRIGPRARFPRDDSRRSLITPFRSSRLRPCHELSPARIPGASAVDHRFPAANPRSGTPDSRSTLGTQLTRSRFAQRSPKRVDGRRIRADSGPSPLTRATASDRAVARSATADDPRSGRVGRRSVVHRDRQRSAADGNRPAAGVWRTATDRPAERGRSGPVGRRTGRYGLESTTAEPSETDAGYRFARSSGTRAGPTRFRTRLGRRDRQ